MSDYVKLGAVLRAKDIVGWRGDTPVYATTFARRIQAWQAVLSSVPGTRCALYVQDTVEFICILIAAWQAKKTVWLPPDALPATCDSLASRVDVYIGEFPASYSPLTAELLLLQELTEYSDYALTVPGSAEIVVFTSGSTGEAQAIPKRVTQLLEEVGVLQALFGNIFAESIEIISTVSHQHIYGLLFKVFLPLYCARPIHAVSIHFPEELVSLSSKRPVVLLASPAHLKRFAESEVLRKSAITISAIFSSGGALPGDVSRQMALLANTVPIEIYGSSETGGIAWRQRNDTSDESWQPFPNVSWRIVDEENVIEVLSSHLYEASWFRMADQVKPAGDNRFLLQGRTDRIVKIEEKRVSLDAIERGLSKSSLVSSARAILVDMEDKTGRQRIAAFVVLSHKGREILASNGKLELNRQLRDVLQPSFERVALPKIWRYLDELPTNMQGKTTYAALKAALDMDASQILPEVQVLVQEKYRLLVTLKVSDDLLYFKGHFPDRPLLPGVVQINWAFLYARRYLNVPDAFNGIDRLKFQNMITPGTSMHLELLYEQEKSHVMFRYFSSDGLSYATGRIRLSMVDG